MGVRLILVSVVAGLGLTLPTTKQVTSWKGSAQSWMSARLADYDARMPADEKAFIYVADTSPFPDDQPDAHTVAATKERPAPAASAIAPKAASIAPEALAAGIETPTAPMDLDDIEALTASPAGEILDVAFEEAQSETLKVFAADRESLIVLPAPAANLAAAVEPETISTTMDLNDSDDMQEGLAYLFQVETTNTADRPGAIENTAPEVCEDLYPGMAYALNRESEGLNPSESNDRRPAARAVETVNSNTSLNQAVKLTREAVYAWANLLHAPAVVTINH